MAVTMEELSSSLVALNALVAKIVEGQAAAIAPPAITTAAPTKAKVEQRRRVLKDESFRRLSPFEGEGGGGSVARRHGGIGRSTSARWLRPRRLREWSS